MDLYFYPPFFKRIGLTEPAAATEPDRRHKQKQVIAQTKHQRKNADSTADLLTFLALSWKPTPGNNNIHHG